MGKTLASLLWFVALVLAACGGGSTAPVTTHEVEPESAGTTLPELMETPDFTLIDLHGSQFGKVDLLGKVWLVDFIFTRCGGPCPLMTQLMKTVQDGLAEAGLAGPDAPVRLVSITVDPEYDTPEVLSEYAETWQADTSIWTFLTGSPEVVLSTVRDGFKITAEREGSGGMPGMPNIVHGTSFLLVDQAGWVRRIVRLDEPDFERTVMRDVQLLLSE